MRKPHEAGKHCGEFSGFHDLSYQRAMDGWMPQACYPQPGRPVCLLIIDRKVQCFNLTLT